MIGTYPSFNSAVFADVVMTIEAFGYKGGVVRSTTAIATVPNRSFRLIGTVHVRVDEFIAAEERRFRCRSQRLIGSRTRSS